MIKVISFFLLVLISSQSHADPMRITKGLYGSIAYSNSELHSGYRDYYKNVHIDSSSSRKTLSLGYKFFRYFSMELDYSPTEINDGESTKGNTIQLNQHSVEYYEITAKGIFSFGALSSRLRSFVPNSLEKIEFIAKGGLGNSKIASINASENYSYKIMSLRYGLGIEYPIMNNVYLGLQYKKPLSFGTDKSFELRERLAIISIYL